MEQTCLDKAYQWAVFWGCPRDFLNPLQYIQLPPQLNYKGFVPVTLTFCSFPWTGMKNRSLNFQQNGISSVTLPW